ncbi:MAG: Endoplasmic reticulum zinc transporter [Caeruleum heppii]|nr:MAG: Endoplasmic reticulum zinc transporter [Caeruleum heppii]
MASSRPLPLPIPPRTPTPPPDENERPSTSTTGLGLDNVPFLSPTKATFDPNSLSPMQENFPTQYMSMSDKLADHSSTSSSGHLRSPANSVYSWSSLDSAGTVRNDQVSGSSEAGGQGPFNFQTVALAKSPVARSNVGQRRGHKYKHSSVSHQIFLEPPPRAPLALPASLPIPTLKECRRSMSTEQRSRISWCLCHALVAGYTWWSAQGSLALVALSHLILFDALGATVCVVVDVLGNFEVWKRSSIRHPFGLERAEVLAGFAMSVFLLFMGMDLISHNLQHILESIGHEPHHEHNHQRVSPGSVDVASLVAIVSTLVSAIGLKNHARIGKAMRFAYIESLPSVLSNPSHFLTLSCSALLLLLPLLSVQMYIWLDRALSSTIAISMCVLGFRLVKNLAFMLLMSYSGTGVSDVMSEIESDAAVTSVDEARFWQVHYGLCMANLKLRVRGNEEGLVRLRERVASLIRNRLGGGYGSGTGQRWEVSTQMTVERN